MPQLFKEFSLSESASLEAIEAASSDVGLPLPKDYCDFISVHNGGEGFIGDSYLILWAVEELSIFNAEYQVSEYAPGLLLFGSDGGGEAYAFDCRNGLFPIVRVPFIGMDLKYAKPIAKTFSDFFLILASSNDG